MQIYSYDFIGFGALNVDMFYSIMPNRRLEDIVSDLVLGGERIGTESERDQVIRNAEKYAKMTGKSGGGQSANTAVALARMGFKCGFIGKVGNDELGNLLLQSMENVDIKHIQRGGNSGTCLCLLDQNGERANIVFPACNDTVSISESDINYAKSSKFLYLSSFCNDDIIFHQEKLISQDMTETKIAFDPGEIYSRLGMNRLYKILQHTNILFATLKEIELITKKDYQIGIKEIIECGTDIVVCKMSEQGSRIITKEDEILIPITKVEKVIDKTGAGDVYSAGFIAGMLLGLPLDLCGNLASQTSAISITGYGRENYPDKEFLRKYIDNIKEKRG
jgi:ribokinase